MIHTEMKWYTQVYRRARGGFELEEGMTKIIQIFTKYRCLKEFDTCRKKEIKQ